VVVFVAVIAATGAVQRGLQGKVRLGLLHDQLQLRHNLVVVAIGAILAVVQLDNVVALGGVDLQVLRIGI